VVLLNDIGDDRQEATRVRGNATIRHTNAALVGISAVVAPVVVTSRELQRLLAPVLRRLRLPATLLERVAGVLERRNWAPEYRFDDGAVEAGRRALAEAGVAPHEVGLLINTSVTRKFLEPSVAVGIHHKLGLPSSAMNFDIANACLGFVNGMTVAAQMIDAGQIRYALVVAAEDTADLSANTISRLTTRPTERDRFLEEFASLTLGSGAAAALIGPADEHPEGHRMIGGISRAGTEHHQLCIGDVDGMFTDAAGLLRNGMDLVTAAWAESADEWDWHDMDRYVTHQVSSVHTEAIIEAIGIDPKRVPTTFPHWGNVGPASLPMTLAAEAPSLSAGDRVLCMGVGSGINTSMLELVW